MEMEIKTTMRYHYLYIRIAEFRSLTVPRVTRMWRNWNSHIMLKEMLSSTCHFRKLARSFKKKILLSFSTEIILSVLEFHLNAIAPYEPFCIKLLSLITVPLKFICIVVYVSGFFPFTAEQYSVVWISHSLFIQSLM